MGRYLITWELDMSKVPINPKERGELWAPMVEMVRDGMKRGTTKDWGSFLGEMKGYSVAEGTELEIANLLQQWTPFVHFTTHPIISLDEMAEVIKNLTK